MKQKFLAETFKMKNQWVKIKMDSKGSILIIATLILGIMLFTGTYFISFSLTGSKMSDSQIVSAETYYLAEAGIQDAIFKLKNDSDWKNAFETKPTSTDPTCSSWSIAPYTRTDCLFEEGSYTITVTNLGCAKAEIKSQAKIKLPSGKVAQRIVKTKVFKAIGNPVSDFDIFTGGPSENVYIKSTDPLNVHGGNLFSSNNINIKNGSVVNVDKKALAHGNINVVGSQLNATSCSANTCDPGCTTSTDCPPAQISMPPLDFDFYRQEAESSDCGSLRTDGKTNCVFTPEEFEKLMWQNYPKFSLPTGTVSYITGDVNIRAGQELTINGVLAADRDINIGKDNCWTRPEDPYLRCGSSQVTVKRPGDPAEDKPSGLLASRKINTGKWLGFGIKALYIEGLVYAGDEMRLTSIAAPVEIHGGIAVRKFTLSSMWQGIDIYLDPDVIIDTFGDAQYSPVITIDHWEEEY